MTLGIHTQRHWISRDQKNNRIESCAAKPWVDKHRNCNRIDIVMSSFYGLKLDTPGRSLYLVSMRKNSIAKTVGHMVDRGGEDRLWTYRDFKPFSESAVAAALSRLKKSGLLVR